MSKSFYYNENSSQSQALDSSNATYRVCREINPWHSFNIPPPSPKRSVHENDETAVLILESFQRPPILNFGKVTLGNISTKSFQILNPAHFVQELEVVKVPKPEYGFTIKVKSIIIEEDQSKTIDVEWKPLKAGGTRNKIHFTSSFGEKFELTLIGTAQEKSKTVTKRRVKPRRRPVAKLEKLKLSPQPNDDFDIKVKASITIQKYFRRFIARKNFLRLKQATIEIQKYWRCYSARKLVNRRATFAKQSLLPESYLKLCRSIDQGVSPPSQIAVAINNLSVSESLQVHDTPALPIGFRTDLALTKLVNYRRFCQLQSALSSLETTTKISPESCLKIASAITVDTIINIIKKSNRSEPSKLVVSHAFNILLNLIKYDKTQDLIINRHSIINLCIEKAKVHIRLPCITNKCLTLLYLIIVKSPNKDLIISDPIITKNLTSLINLESSTIKSHKKHKISKEIIFYPYWSSAKGVMYEFTDRFTALEHINHLYKGKLF